jgi:hypothetical protein
MNMLVIILTVEAIEVLVSACILLMSGAIVR